MKLILLLFTAILVSLLVYFVTKYFFSNSSKFKKVKLNPIKTAIVVFILFTCLIAYGVFSSDHQPDLQCFKTHTSNSKSQAYLLNAGDYYNQANYEYDIGNCKAAIINYTQAIKLNSQYAQAYNNRAYTYMRLRDYQNALPDLDKAIEIKPKYIQALMNRGDIHNYYYQIDRKAAIDDYKRVISLTGPTGGGTSVCGHLLLAKHNGWNLGTVVAVLTGARNKCN